MIETDSPLEGGVAAGSDVVLDVAGLRAAYGHVPVLHGIDFRLKAGEAVGIVGHNGVGKTTFLKALIGLVPTTAGRISIDGIDVTRMKAHDRSRLGIGYVPQGRGILPGLTTLENLRLAWTPDSGDTEPAAIERVVETLPRLQALLDRKGTEFLQELLCEIRGVLLSHAFHPSGDVKRNRSAPSRPSE
jgi:ABC-type branched-subunit amino acid transport system ATPase component